MAIETLSINCLAYFHRADINIPVCGVAQSDVAIYELTSLMRWPLQCANRERITSFTNAKPAEYFSQQIVRCEFAGNA